MATKEGQLFICDRCNRSQFIETGQFYEKGWMTLPNSQCTTLCSECTKSFKIHMISFFGDKVPEDWKL